LRQKTGFDEMRFDDAGLLVLGDRSRCTSGSKVARELLAMAIDGRLAFDLKASNTLLPLLLPVSRLGRHGRAFKREPGLKFGSFRWISRTSGIAQGYLHWEATVSPGCPLPLSRR
jgi:hypothetical protein